MASSGGTAEQILNELGRVFQPLAGWVADDTQFAGLLGSLGLEVEDSAQLLQLRQAVSGLVSSIETLEGHLQDLQQTLNTDPVSESELLSIVTELALNIEGLVGNIPELGSALNQLNSIDAGHLNTVVNSLPQRLVELLIMAYLQKRSGLLHDFLRLIGIFEYIQVEADDVVPIPQHFTRQLNLGRIGELLDSSTPIFESVFGWGTASFNPALLFSMLSDLCTKLSVPTVLVPGTPPALHIGQSILTPVGGGLNLVFQLTPDPVAITIPSNLPVDLELNAEVNFARRPTILLRPGQPINVRQLDPSQQDISTGGLDLLITYPKNADSVDPVVVLGKLGGSRFEAERFELGVGMDFILEQGQMKIQPSMFAKVQAGRLVIELGEGDGFIQNITGGGGLEFGFDFGVGYDTERGVYILEGMGLEMRLPMHLQLGPIKLDEFILGLQVIDEGLRIEASTTLGGDFGILKFAVERIGMNADILLGQADDKPVDFRLGFRPPTGVGLVVDAGGVTGGGYLYFDHEEGEYAGVLELAFAGLTLQAIGLLSTRTPEGEDTFSFLAIITVQFSPGLQLGFGFSLNGVGGILGVHRATEVDVLRDGLRNGTMGSILFPEDPVANAPQLLQDLRSVFPSVEDRHLFGPVLAIGWGAPISVLEIQLGVILELPSPVRIILLGRITMDLPHKDLAIAKLNLDLLGVFDSEKQEISLDASLYDSFIGIFSISGDMAMRLGYGSNPLFALSIGGFHPRFTPPPAFPELRRMAISLGSGNNPRVRLEAYTALTSNTVQVGAGLELYASKLGFSVEGGLSFDALFQFNPFMFVVDFNAHLSVKKGRTTIMSIGVSVSLSGVSPWRVQGSASFKVLLLKVSIPFNKTFGDSTPTLPQEQLDVAGLLLDHLGDTGNWNAALPTDDVGHLVSLSTSATNGGELLVHPLGVVTVLQKIAPFGITIEQYGQAQPSNGNRFELDADIILGQGSSAQTIASEPEYENFAPAHYFNLTNDEKLSRPSFELEHAGASFGGGTNAGEGVSRVRGYEEKIIDRRFRQHYDMGLTGVKFGVTDQDLTMDREMYRGELIRLSSNAKGFFSGRVPVANPGATPLGPTPMVTVNDPQFTLVQRDDMRIAERPVSGSYTLARDRMNRISQGNQPLQVVEDFEVELARQVA